MAPARPGIVCVGLGPGDPDLMSVKADRLVRGALHVAFFRKVVLILSPMVVAIVSCIVTMALLVATGNTIHIMSSMVPIFIMPIAVLDSIHILSEFFDRYQESKNRATAIRSVMNTLAGSGR